MKIFNVNFQGEKNSIYCKCENTRNGFKHVATMNYNGNTYVATSYYINRTWEYFEYQSVIRKLYYIISDEIKEKALNQENVKKHIEGKQRVKVIVIKNKIVNIVIKG